MTLVQNRPTNDWADLNRRLARRVDNGMAYRAPRVPAGKGQDTSHDVPRPQGRVLVLMPR